MVSRVGPIEDLGSVFCHLPKPPPSSASESAGLCLGSEFPELGSSLRITPRVQPGPGDSMAVNQENESMKNLHRNINDYVGKNFPIY